MLYHSHKVLVNLFSYDSIDSFFLASFEGLKFILGVDRMIDLDRLIVVYSCRWLFNAFLKEWRDFRWFGVNIYEWSYKDLLEKAILMKGVVARAFIVH